jgi:hypothetical protein
MSGQLMRKKSLPVSLMILPDAGFSERDARFSLLVYRQNRGRHCTGNFGRALF